MEHALPSHNGDPIVFVPKFSVRHHLALNSQEFYTHHMLEFLQGEYLEANSSLVEVLKNGKRRVTKKSIKEIHPFIKNDLADFVSQHPEVMARYKKLKGAEGPLTNAEISRIVHEELFDARVLARALIEELRDIPTGTDDAGRYHSFAMGVCTFLFYPGLSHPQKEAPINDGQKRLDIRYTNTGVFGFFGKILQAPNMAAHTVAVECKNYGTEVSNPEVDQLIGRFGHQRGKVGFLLCRRVQNKMRLIDRCRHSARDGRGFVIVLDDADLVSMLEMVENGIAEAIPNYLDKKLIEITN